LEYTGGIEMADHEDTVLVQLATRIPKTLHRDLKLHCVTSDVSVMAFVTRAIAEKLAKPISRGTRRRASASR
jgi:predicted HicB family RNase H-like nuclease